MIAKTRTAAVVTIFLISEAIILYYASLAIGVLDIQSILLLLLMIMMVVSLTSLILSAYVLFAGPRA